MTHQELLDAVSEWNAGDSIRLTFLPGTGPKQDLSSEQVTALAYLLLGAGKKDLKFTDPTDLLAVQTAGYWDKDKFRVAEGTVLVTMGIRSFVERMHAALESVEVIPA
jgi:hypothetical protein